MESINPTTFPEGMGTRTKVRLGSIGSARPDVPTGVGKILARLANASYLERQLGPEFFSSVSVTTFHLVVPELASLHPLCLQRKIGWTIEGLKLYPSLVACFRNSDRFRLPQSKWP